MDHQCDSRSRLMAAVVLCAPTFLVAQSALSEGRNGRQARDVMNPRFFSLQATVPRAKAVDRRSMPMLVIGDRLKIRFMEQMEIAPDPASQRKDGPTPSISTVIERTDLSGSYDLQFNGLVTVPRLGSFDLGGQSIEDATSLLRSACERLMQSSCEVHISILQRPPVMVLGSVRNPGSFQYVHGMRALHALALAGGLKHKAEWQSHAMNVQRELRKRQEAVMRLQRLLALKARVDAELHGHATVQEPREFVRVAGGPDLTRLTSNETRKLEFSLRFHESQLKTKRLVVANAEREVGILAKRNEHLERLVQVRSERHAGLTNLAQRGSASNMGLLAAYAELVDAETRLQEGKLAHVLAEQRANTAKRSLQDYQHERQSSLEAERQRLDEQIREASADEDASRSVLGIMGVSVDANSVTDLPPQTTYKLLRNGVEGSVWQRIDEMADLQPGDLIQVDVAPGPTDQTPKTVVNIEHAPIR
jgi:protein involved in polysaccharide export with SLBB domain